LPSSVSLHTLRIGWSGVTNHLGTIYIEVALLYNDELLQRRLFTNKNQVKRLRKRH